LMEKRQLLVSSDKFDSKQEQHKYSDVRFRHENELWKEKTDHIAPSEPRTEIIEDLIRLGLTLDEAKVYISALKLGRTTASEIARSCGLDESSVHHKIRDLVRLEILEKELGVPNLFYARKPKASVEVLLGRFKAELDSRVRIAKSTISDLDQLLPQQSLNAARETTMVYKLLKTDRELDTEMIRNLQMSESEVMMIQSTMANMRLPATGYGGRVHAAGRRCHERGVIFRAISEGGPHPLPRFMQVKHHKFLGLLVTVFDRKRVQFGPDFPGLHSSLKQHPTIACNEEYIAEAFAELFEHLWEESTV